MCLPMMILKPVTLEPGPYFPQDHSSQSLNTGPGFTDENQPQALQDSLNCTIRGKEAVRVGARP